MNGNKFATGQILEKPVEVVKGRNLAGWAQKTPEPWCKKGPTLKPNPSNIGTCQGLNSFTLAYQTLFKLNLETNVCGPSAWENDERCHVITISM
jgi:hypothetical protein